MKISVKPEYTSVACNRVPSIVDWNSDGLIIYGASNAVIIYDTNITHGDPCTVHNHHNGRINSVKWLRHSNGTSAEFVTSSNDKTAALWGREGDCWRVRTTLKGHTEGVTYIDGIYIGDKLVLYTASIDSTIKIWEIHNDETSVSQTIPLGSGLCLTLRACVAPQCAKPILFAALDDHKIYVYGPSADNGEVHKLHALVGHEDWVRGLDVMVADNTSVLLASCSQDTYIRIWKLQLQGKASNHQSNGVQVEEKVFKFHGVEFSMKLDAVLSGHEAWVYGVQWHPPVYDKVKNSSTPVYRLFSTSMDKTAIIWEPESQEESYCGEGDLQGVWVEKVRVGEVGGNGLGFYGGVFGPQGESFVTHGYNGSFHMWTLDKELDIWQPKVVCSGHYSEVVDLRWEPTGKYLCSASCDQTTRIHAKWSEREQWYELARPQVHGYDMSSIAFISSTTFVSAAEEKVLRVFEAPHTFVHNYKCITGMDLVEGEYCGGAGGATVPTLGLSNKPMSDGDIIDANEAKSDTYFVAVKLTEPPTEETLMQSTLWPETHKLYGHGYEVYCCDATADGSLVASACKATSMEHCAIIIWETKTWRQLQSLESHSLTVTQLAFAPNSQMLLSVSRDRKWTLFKRAEGGNSFDITATTDKTNGVHSRIIWCCAWTIDSDVFSTGSRDGKICLWSKTDVKSDTSLKDYALLGTTLETGISVTALAFAPIKYDITKSRMLAAGFESGLIRLYYILDDKWNMIYEFDKNSAHHLTVKRLCFNPQTVNNEYQLASCGSDNSVRIHHVNVSL